MDYYIKDRNKGTEHVVYIKVPRILLSWIINRKIRRLLSSDFVVGEVIAGDYILAKRIKHDVNVRELPLASNMAIIIYTTKNYAKRIINFGHCLPEERYFKHRKDIKPVEVKFIKTNDLYDWRVGEVAIQSIAGGGFAIHKKKPKGHIRLLLEADAVGRAVKKGYATTTDKNYARATKYIDY